MLIMINVTVNKINNESFFPDIDKTVSFQHDVLDDGDEIFWRHDVAEHLKNDRHILNREDKSRKENGWQHQRYE